MLIEVRRYILTKSFTVGHLYIDGQFFCHTLEDMDRELSDDLSEDENLSKKIYGVTAIPIGEYKLTIDYSNKYKKYLPHILNVKAFDGIRFHSLNYAKESLGCVGVGNYNGNGMIINSRKTMNAFQPIIQEAIDSKQDVKVRICYEETVTDMRK